MPSWMPTVCGFISIPQNPLNCQALFPPPHGNQLSYKEILFNFFSYIFLHLERNAGAFRSPPHPFGIKKDKIYEKILKIDTKLAAALKVSEHAAGSRNAHFVRSMNNE